eukprot:gb/GEZN01004967.1/.p1 GENE.gb/GEZN01004967.1/~~gb/GEZN01004967.1/.p1  ORF type:complete len:567 (+),score=75.42 gb/GEZN01004967.1/:118-1818(+)
MSGWTPDWTLPEMQASAAYYGMPMAYPPMPYPFMMMPAPPPQPAIPPIPAETVRVVVVPKAGPPIPSTASAVAASAPAIPRVGPVPLMKEGRGTIANRSVNILQPAAVPIDKDADYVPMQCDDNYNLNSMLMTNILESPYSVTLGEMTTMRELVEEIKHEVTHLEPYATTKSTRLPSTAFCILYRLFVVRLTQDQLHEMVTDSLPFIRGMGFLFIRIVVPPQLLWDWYQPYLDDPMPIKACGSQGPTTIGRFLRGLIEDHKYYGTMLRRIPVTLQREMIKKIESSKQEQAKPASRTTVATGTKCKALFEDGEAYPVQVEEILPNNKYLVRWLQYDYTEEVDFASLILPGDDAQIGKASSSNGNAKRRGGERSERRTMARRSRSSSKRRKRGGSRSPSKTRRKRASSRSKSKERSKGKSKEKERRSKGRSKERQARSNSKSKRKGAGQTSSRSNSRGRKVKLSRSKSKDEGRKGRRSRSRSKSKDEGRKPKRSRSNSARKPKRSRSTSKEKGVKRKASRSRSLGRGRSKRKSKERSTERTKEEKRERGEREREERERRREREKERER